ncbi:hypothetical protein PUN28_009009 [Cardiocondyla obscurior]|uniref:Secreted protein n=1 Tax=Cardiocondyla obscurior TaxID=286306 RepID=A0AAW2FPZ9_9HYME
MLTRVEKVTVTCSGLHVVFERPYCLPFLLLFVLQCSLTVRAYGTERDAEHFRSINVRAQRNTMPEQEAVKLTRRGEVVACVLRFLRGRVACSTTMQHIHYVYAFVGRVGVIKLTLNLMQNILNTIMLSITLTIYTHASHYGN